LSEATPRKLVMVSEPADIAYRSIARAGGVIVLVIMTGIGVFLALRAGQAITKSGVSFLWKQAWEPDANNFGIAAVLIGTFIIASVAIVIALPLSLGTALYISEYAPRGLQRSLISLVDLMAAIPSVVFGLWGFFSLQGNVIDVAKWISKTFGWIPIFAVDGFSPDEPLSSDTVFTASSFIAGIVVALMITPIMTSIMREVFSQAPVGEREGALGLGATKWGMLRSVVLPYGVGGIIGATMLGLGRALGETIAVYMIISPVFAIQPHVLQSGASSISSLIALKYGEATTFGMSALMAAGLTLFLVTLVVNFGASMIVARSRSGQSS